MHNVQPIDCALRKDECTVTLEAGWQGRGRASDMSECEGGAHTSMHDVTVHASSLTCACASMCGKWIVCPAFGVLGVCMGLVMGFRV